MSSVSGSPVASGLGRGFTHGRPALVTYLMAGYPDRATSLEALRAAARAGADVIELGVPYSDPLADGPVIVNAGEVARRANGGRFGLAETLELAAEFVSSEHDAPPIALMTYVNPMLRYGFDRVAREAEGSVAGFIVPDLPPDGPFAAQWVEQARSHALDTVFLVAPTSTPDRLAKVGQMSSGFVYCVSTTGITGERTELSDEIADLVAGVKEHTTLPVAVGFGVSTPEQAERVAKVADGVIVGSAIVKRQDDVASLAAFVSDLAAAVHRTR